MPPPGTNVRKQCFIIGPFGEEKSAIRKWSDALVADVIGPIAREFGYDARRSIEYARPRDITNDVVGKLLQADLVVADLTSANANVYYELAIRHAIEQPFMHLIQEGQHPPFDVKNLDVLTLPTKVRKGIVLPDAPRSIERLRPYFAAVTEGTASYSSILAGQQIGKTMLGALAELESRRAALEKQHAGNISLLPQIVRQSIFRYADGLPLYYRSFSYDIELTHADGKVEYVMKVAFELANVSDHPQTVLNRYPTPTRAFRLESATVDGHAVDLQDPSLYSREAVILKYQIPPGESVTFDVCMAKSFAEREDDFFTAYLYPAESFRFRATNRSPDTLIAWVEMLHSQNALASRTGNVIDWTAEDPILPNQGIRLLWRPKNENHG
jgi:hypothetical protein